MSELNSPQALRARWVIPVGGPPIDGGVVTFHGSRILAVGRRAQDCKPVELGDVAILPGLVNAHTHLEFSDCTEPLGCPGMPLPTWIRAVVARRRAADATAASTVVQGLQQSIAAGVTTLGEIATSDWRSDVRAHGGNMPLVRMFFELIAARSERIAAAVATAQAFLESTPDSASIDAGLSPHASYTVHPELLIALVAFSKQFDAPLAMHLAESPDEIELLASGSGLFVDLLRDFGAWQEDPGARWPRILNYLQQMAHAPRALVIHGNYLAHEEIEFLAQQAATMSVVYCPRTHHYFRHAPYPLTRMIESGVRMALGTDSRASNPDLDLLAEMRFVRDHHSQLSAQMVVALGTIDGARALGLADRVGTLSAGKLANLVVVQPSAAGPTDPYEAVLAEGAHVTQTWVGGSQIGPLPCA